MENIDSVLLSLSDETLMRIMKQMRELLIMEGGTNEKSTQNTD